MDVAGPFARPVEGVDLIHLLICREYPPAAYPPGGIGTYAREISTALARAGEQVHVIAHRWAGAPARRDETCDGRLIVHRVAMDDRPEDPALVGVPASLLGSACPTQAFAWQAARLAEHLIETAGVDVIEAQEWEAPLYYLMLRRATGLGPARRPPCVVHIHSPSARIFAANGWDTTVADFAPLAEMEAYTIAHADAVLCPSRFIADETTRDYALDPATVHVVPYPRPATPFIERDDHTWRDGGICHVGRLEPRKGVLEWSEAIARLAGEHPTVSFDFVGGDTPLAVTGGPGVQQAMLARLPRMARRRIRFHGTTDADGVARVLASAALAVVPSRWENFPFSCLEAMSSGLPVLVSPHGGMREIVTDGVSGWVARDGSPDGLAEAARRALDTPADRRREMGGAAADTVRRVCDPPEVVRRHLAVRRALVSASATSSTVVDVARVKDPSRPSLGVVIDGGGASAVTATMTSLSSAGVSSAHVQAGRPFAPAVADLLALRPAVSVVALVEAGVVVDGPALWGAASWLASQAGAGLVVPWVREVAPRGLLALADRPSQPFLLASGQVAPVVLLRREELVTRHVDSRLAACRAASSSASYPMVTGCSPVPMAPVGGRRQSSMAGAVQRLHMPVLSWLRTCSPEARRRFLADGLRSPGRSLRWLAGRTADLWRRPGSRGMVSASPEAVRLRAR